MVGGQKQITSLHVDEGEVLLRKREENIGVLSLGRSD